MKPMRGTLNGSSRWAVILLLLLAACDGVPLASPGGSDGTAAASLAGTPQLSSQNQLAATAEVQRASSQATLDAAISTLRAAEAQNQNAANIVAAQIAATAEVQRADAQSTLVAAGSTQNAALIQDALLQKQAADQVTNTAEAARVQRNAELVAASTQTAVAEGIATEARSAVATSQWYTEQARQRDAQRQVPITFLWTWCWPAFLLLLAGLAAWGFWRWLRLRQARQRIFNDLLEERPESPAEAPQPPAAYLPPYIEGDSAKTHYEVTEPQDPVHRWLDEVKRKLQSGDQKDKDDDADG